jgi:glutaredoxin
MTNTIKALFLLAATAFLRPSPLHGDELDQLDSPVLYSRSSCSCSAEVLSFIDDNNLVVEIMDLDVDLDAQNALFEATNTTQVPCLFNGETYIFESNNIIAYLSESDASDEFEDAS